MIILFVFDSHLEIDAFSSFCKKNKIKRIDIFPLTSDLRIHNKVKIALKTQCPDSICWLNSSEMIDEKVKYLREDICKWSANIGEANYRGKKIKEWFLLPGSNVSTWWFSLLSEKNTFKTDGFFKIAQVHAIKKALKTGQYTLCVTSIVDSDLRNAVNNVAYNLNMRIKLLPATLPKSIKTNAKELLKRLGVLGNSLSGISTLVKAFTRGCLARQHLGTHSKRLPKSDSILFVSYFPAVDKDAAQKGIFRNKYWLPLQDKLKEMGIPIVWLFMYVPNDGITFNDTLRMAANFAGKGEKLFVLEEFLTLKHVVSSFLLWIRQIILSFLLFGFVKRTCLLSEPIGDECEPILKSLWNLSFGGHIGIRGIIYYSIFRQAFKDIHYIYDCLYYCEMHAWEKALNAAKNLESPQVRTIAFQHSSVTKNYFHYFYDKNETISTNKDSDLPLPDIVACNGKILFDLLAKSGYQNLTMVEALRYVYLDKVISALPQPRNSNPLLLVAGSIDKTESTNLITLVNAAFPKAEIFDIWFKGHPSMPFEKLFEDVEINISERGYMICHNNISECLDSAWAVLVPSSTVSIEALAFGCEVIVPVFPNSMLMNPLADFKGFYHKVTSPEELGETMCKIVNGYKLHSINEYKEFVRKYWCIDRTLPKWTRLLRTNE